MNIWRRQPSSRLSSGYLVKDFLVAGSELIAQEFWEAPTGYFGVLKRWTGFAWVKALLKVFLAGSWQAKPLKWWDGTGWTEIDTSME